MRTSNPSNDRILAVAAAAFVAAPVMYYRLLKPQKEEQDGSPSLSNIASLGSKFKPPFPQAVRNLLSKCRLAYLSTVDTDAASSHLSLMRFTYVHDEEDGEIVVMSTNRKTKKFDMLRKQKGVALLVHDFAEEGKEGQYSITLNGDCRIVTDLSKEERYRRLHLEHNPDYPQFIVGDDIAILCVDVTSARICNIHDQVVKWDITDSRASLRS